MALFEIGDRDPLFFMHIPKTAGMSMRLYLGEQYNINDVCPIADWQGLLGREGDLPLFRLLRGHFRYNLRALIGENVRMLVMLRDPLRRTVSVLRHLQRDPHFHPDHEIARHLTLSQMIRHPKLMSDLCNTQARFLCASMIPSDVSAYLERELPNNPRADAGDLEDPPDLQLAMDRLESIDFVGLTENIGSVVSIMAQKMNYHPPLYFPFINENPTHVDPLQGVAQEDIDIIREHNDMDLKIYDFAKRLNEERTFKRSMRQLISSGVYKVPPGSFELPVSGIMPGSGWYEPEHEDGTYWRWTGPSRYFTIEVPLRQDASYRLIMTFGSVRPIGPGGFAADVNDMPIALELVPEGGAYRCELLIPQPLLEQSSGFCRIKFDTRETTQPTSQDIRALGISVRNILFECQYAACDPRERAPGGVA